MIARDLLGAADAIKSRVTPANSTKGGLKARVQNGAQSGTLSNDAVKVKGVITWVAQADAVPAEVPLYDRLFKDEHPDSLKVITAYVEPSLANAQADEKFQFERHCYFATDRAEHTFDKLVFNRAAGLKDNWAK